MRKKIFITRRYSFISYVALSVGIVCLLIIVVNPIRLAALSSPTGTYTTLALMVIGVICAIIALTKKQKKNYCRPSP